MEISFLSARSSLINFAPLSSYMMDQCTTTLSSHHTIYYTLHRRSDNYTIASLFLSFFYDSRRVYQIGLNILWRIFLSFLNLLFCSVFILMQSLFGTRLCAFVAENAFCPIFTFAGFFVNLYTHRADLQAFAAEDAFTLVTVNA